MAAKKKSEAIAQPETQSVVIKPMHMDVVEFELVGTAPLVTNRFSAKADIMKTQSEGSTAKKGKKREPKDFEANYEKAKHVSTDGWCGVHAGAFRAAMVSACRLVGFKMTLAKLSLFVLADGYDNEGTPLIRIYGEPEMVTHHARNDNGSVDIRARPMWKAWKMRLRIRYDGDQFTPVDIANLINRVGAQVGIGEGRPDSRDSVGMGWGTFAISNEESEAAE